METNSVRIWAICKDCAQSVYANVPPNQRYADATARLLFGTAAQESGLEWERQRGITDSRIGGFSKWQIEPGSISDSLRMLRENKALLTHSTQFLFRDPNASIEWILKASTEQITWAMRLDDNDKIGALFARLHYFRVADPIPATVQEQAAYWKQYYNTVLGAGKPSQYLANWNELCARCVN